YHDVAVNVSYSKMLSSMRTSRKKRVFPDFHSYSEFRDLLYSEDWQQLRWYDGTSTVEVTVHNSGEENESLVYSSTMETCNTLPAEELLVVTSILEKKAFLCFFALIKTKDNNCYREIINQLVTILPTPTRIFGNFNAELHHHLETVYPNAEIKGSFYSYCNILFQSVTDFGVFQNEDNEIFVRKLMALALLPDNKMNIVYTAIKSAIPDNQKNIYQNFLLNFEEKWLRNVGPHRISCFKNMLQLSTVPRATANVLMNSKINNQPVWTMLEFIGTIFYKNEINIKSLRDGKRASRKTCLQLDYLISKNVMDRIVKNLKGRHPNYAVFLASASFQLKDSFQTFRHNYEKRVIQSDNLLPLIGDNLPDDNVNVITLTAQELFLEINPDSAPTRNQLNNDHAAEHLLLNAEPLNNDFDIGDQDAAHEEIPDDPWNAIELPLIAEDMVQEMVEPEETFEDFEMLLEEYEEDLDQLTKNNAAVPQTNEVVSNSVLNIEAAADESFILESEVLGIINPILMDDQNCVECKIKTAECVMLPCLHFNLCYSCSSQKVQQL
ncbi:Protein of unknown function, partial [Cotesia congregata]